MKQQIQCSVLIFLLFFSINPFAQGQDIEQKTAKMAKYVGYFDTFWENKTGKLYLKVDKFNQEFLLLGSLRAGVGSNDIGLDRGQLGRERIVKFQRIGNKVLLVQPNYKFRAETSNIKEQQAVAEAFAQSVLWGFTVVASDEQAVLIDLTNFCLQDMHGIAGQLRATKQGNYAVDKSRSAVLIEESKNFPKNTEIEALLTFKGSPKGNYIRSVTPTASLVTVRTHYSFIQLPDDNYQKRELDPRFGFLGISYSDYAVPLGQPMEKHFLARHRLQKANPTAAVSEPVEPIIYYLDPGTPEPIRSALLDGARWWDEAFEAAGFKNAFIVKMLPEDADPMDVRYNVIQWVHRSTRGWSYGASVVDPRTGEIIKGHVSLGSLRVRQDYLLAEGLSNPYKKGEKPSKEMEKLALARLRQLSAHEVGHTIGLMHNFAASTNARASVMDYPHPYVTLKDGKLDLSDAYDTGIGEWDKIAITLGYAEFNGKDEKAELNKLVQDYIQKGYHYISDQDARPMGAAHPRAHLWDNGESAVTELDRLIEVRKQAIKNFSEEAIPEGYPMTKLEEVFVPVYLMHRYQLEATSKLLGGLSYNYALRGDGQVVTEIVDAKTQQAALQSLLNTLEAEQLAIPERILKLIPPRAPGYPRNRETFKSKTGVSFDPMTAVQNAADATLSLLLHRERTARLVEYHARNQEVPSLHGVIEEIMKRTWKAKRQSGYQAAVQHTVEKSVLHHLIQLASDKKASEQVRAVAYLKLDECKTWLAKQLDSTTDYNQKAHIFYAIQQLNQFQQHPDQFYPSKQPNIPAGSPIGQTIVCGLE